MTPFDDYFDADFISFASFSFSDYAHNNTAT